MHLRKSSDMIKSSTVLRNFNLQFSKLTKQLFSSLKIAKNLFDNNDFGYKEQSVENRFRLNTCTETYRLYIHTDIHVIHESYVPT